MAHDDRNSSLVITVKYDIFTSIYRINTVSIDVIIQRGKFLQDNQWSYQLTFSKFLSHSDNTWFCKTIRTMFVFYKECLLQDASTWVHTGFLVGSVILIFLVFCVVLSYVFTFWLPCCHVRYDFRIKTMFGWYLLPPVVCRRAHWFFFYTLFVFAGV